MKTLKELGVEKTVENLKERVMANIRPYARRHESYEDFYSSEQVQQWIRESSNLSSDAQKIVKKAIRETAMDAWQEVTE